MYERAYLNPCHLFVVAFIFNVYSNVTSCPLLYSTSLFNESFLVKALAKMKLMSKSFSKVSLWSC